jgi:hypothetical protein
MPTQFSTMRKQYTEAFAIFTEAFPNIQPPSAILWQSWFKENEYSHILEAIHTLRSHSAPVRARYTTDSVVRAINALLREIALQRAIPLSASPSGKSGVQS